MKTFRLLPWTTENSGMGHLIRMQGMAEMLDGNLKYSISALAGPDEILRKAGLNVVLKGAGAPEAEQLLADFSPEEDILVLDGYNYDLAYQLRLKELGFSLVRIDDFANKHIVADLFINHAAGIQESDYTKEPYSRLALGSEYALLRKTLLKRASERPIQGSFPMENVLLSFGSDDAEGLAEKFTEMLFEFPGIKRIAVLGGKASTDERLEVVNNKTSSEMLDVIDEMDLIVCSSSNIFMEMACLSKPTASGYYVDNQRNIAKSIEQSGCAFYLGDLRTVTKAEIEAVLNASNEFWNGSFEAQEKMIDGNQQERILKLLSDV